MDSESPVISQLYVALDPTRPCSGEVGSVKTLTGDMIFNGQRLCSQPNSPRKRPPNSSPWMQQLNQTIRQRAVSSSSLFGQRARDQARQSLDRGIVLRGCSILPPKDDTVDSGVSNQPHAPNHWTRNARAAPGNSQSDRPATSLGLVHHCYRRTVGGVQERPLRHKPENQEPADLEVATLSLHRKSCRKRPSTAHSCAHRDNAQYAQTSTSPRPFSAALLPDSAASLYATDSLKIECLPRQAADDSNRGRYRRIKSAPVTRGAAAPNGNCASYGHYDSRYLLGDSLCLAEEEAAGNPVAVNHCTTDERAHNVMQRPLLRRLMQAPPEKSEQTGHFAACLISRGFLDKQQKVVRKKERQAEASKLREEQRRQIMYLKTQVGCGDIPVMKRGVSQNGPCTALAGYNRHKTEKKSHCEVDIETRSNGLVCEVTSFGKRADLSAVGVECGYQGPGVDETPGVGSTHGFPLGTTTSDEVPKYLEATQNSIQEK